MSKRLCVWTMGLFRKWSFGLCDRIVWYVYTFISEEHTASIFKVEGSSETLVTLYQISWCHNTDQNIFHAVKISYKCLPFSSQVHAFSYFLPFSSYWLHLSRCFLCFILLIYLSHFTSPSLLLLLLSLFQRLILSLLFTFLSQFIAPSLFSFLCLVTHPCTSLPTVGSAPLALLAETSPAHCPPHTQALGMPLSAASLCSSPAPRYPQHQPIHLCLHYESSSRRQYNTLLYRQRRRSMEYELHRELLPPWWRTSIFGRPIKNLKTQMHKQ